MPVPVPEPAPSSQLPLPLRTFVIASAALLASASRDLAETLEAEPLAVRGSTRLSRLHTCNASRHIHVIRMPATITLIVEALGTYNV